MSATTRVETDSAEVHTANVSPEAAKTKGQSTYVVQVAFIPADSAETVYARLEDNVHDWKDIATVTVPGKSPRKKVIGLALAQSGLRPASDSEPLRVRVLDAASAAETVVAPFQPEAEWKVG